MVMSNLLGINSGLWHNLDYLVEFPYNTTYGKRGFYIVKMVGVE